MNSIILYLTLPGLGLASPEWDMLETWNFVFIPLCKTCKMQKYLSLFSVFKDLMRKTNKLFFLALFQTIVAYIPP